ncbi:interleukin-17 receptor D-like, partial [Notothenia coriiceps]|uniref:Interleukin-17 receptor D-like n=1 Tax=Notothenia coriiceps TaxID=8208 RepID=A0A6I9N668_9TELE
VQSDADGGPRLAVTLRADNCSINYPLGKHVIHEVANVSFSHLACEDQAAVIVHWSASPLGIEHIKGFRVYLEDKNPEGKQCQHLLLKDPRQLNCSYKNTRLSSQTFSGLTFDTDYMVRVVPFPTLMNESFFPPSFLRTNSCEVLLGSDNLVCKPYWKPKTLNVSQLGSNLHVAFDQAPSSFGFHFYFLYYKLRQEGPFRQQRCKPDVNQYRTTCILKDVTPGTYTVELRDDSNTTRRQTQYHVVLDLWEHLEMCKEGQMSWLSRQLDESDFIITICSKGLRYYVEKKSRRGKTPVGRRSNSCSSSSSPIGGSGSDLFIVGVAMIAEKLRLANQSEGAGSQELQRYMTVYFDYSTENDIPTMLSLAP